LERLVLAFELALARTLRAFLPVFPRRGNLVAGAADRIGRVRGVLCILGIKRVDSIV
jgi:hypothetical protein